MNKYILIILSVIIFSCQETKKDKVENTASSATKSISKEENKTPTFVMVNPSAQSKVKIKTADTLTVNSIADLVENADHNRTLILSSGKYTLDENLVYYISHDKKEIIDKKQIETRSIGGQIYISGLTNFSILGQESIISSNNPKAPVLYIINANQGLINNLTIKHNRSLKEIISAPSSYISGSKNLTFINCNWGQNSAGGLKLQNTKNLTFNDCKINNTTESIIDATKANSTIFANLEMVNNTCKVGCCNFWGTANSIEFRNSVFQNNKAKAKSGERKRSFFNGPHMNIKFNNCTLLNNENFDDLGIPELKFTESNLQAF